MRWIFHAALIAAAFSGVQASGEISVRAQLVRAHNDISPSPIRALAGAQGVRLGASPTARTLGPVPADRRQNGSAQSEVLVYRGGHHRSNLLRAPGAADARAPHG